MKSNLRIKQVRKSDVVWFQPGLNYCFTDCGFLKKLFMIRETFLFVKIEIHFKSFIVVSPCHVVRSILVRLNNNRKQSLNLIIFLIIKSVFLELHYW